MFETPLNQKTVTMKLKRRDVCDLLLACTAISQDAKENGCSTPTKWDSLHDKLEAILDEFDKKQGF